jgi:hypothetical protein
VAVFLELPGIQATVRGQAQIDAVVTDQVLRPLRLRPLPEIRRRSNDRHAGLDAHGNHVLRHLLAGANAGVKALGGDIGQPVVDADFDLDVRILPQEFYELRPEVSVAPPTATSRRRAWSCCRPCNSRVSDELFPALSHWPRSWRSAI